MAFTPDAPSLDEMETMARAAFHSLPDEFRSLTGGILFAVQDWPERETLSRLGIDSPYGLLGLFHGQPLAVHLANMAGPLPSRIYLYRRPILAFAQHRSQPLEDVVRHVLVHEIGHHFGLSDEDMHAIDDAAE